MTYLLMFFFKASPGLPGKVQNLIDDWNVKVRPGA